MPMSDDRVSKLIQAMTDAAPGEIVIYHVGQLLFDRVGDRNLSAVANHALSLAVHGRAILAQRVMNRLWLGEKYTEFEYQLIAVEHPPKITRYKRFDPPEVIEQQRAAAHARLPREKVVSL